MNEETSLLEEENANLKFRILELEDIIKEIKKLLEER